MHSEGRSKKTQALTKRAAGVIIMLLVSSLAQADIKFVEHSDGDHYVYLPRATAKNILVIAHGMYATDQQPAEVAKTFITRWLEYAETRQLVLIAPVFDDRRFGTLSQGYGGYRNLFGKYLPADEFVNRLVRKYAKYTSSRAEKFYLYGHSAGGQFVARYVVTHPQKIIRAVISAAGRYSYPTKSVQWPYGAGKLKKSIQWDGGQIVQTVSVHPQLSDYALAAGKTSIVIGSADTKAQPRRPGHIGSNRIEFARSWSSSMNAIASRFGKPGKVSVRLVEGVGHNSRRLTPYCAQALFADQRLPLARLCVDREYSGGRRGKLPFFTPGLSARHRSPLKPSILSSEAHNARQQGPWLAYLPHMGDELSIRGC